MIRLLLIVILVLLILPLNYGQSIWNPISLQQTYKPIVLLNNGDTLVGIKVQPFIIFTREFIKGEGAKQREVQYISQAKKDSTYIKSLENSNDKSSREIANQVVQKDSIKTQASVEIGKAQKKVGDRTLLMGIWSTLTLIGGIFIGFKLH